MDEIFGKLLKIRGVRKKDIDLLKLYAGEQNEPMLWEKQFRQIDFEHEPYYYNIALSRVGSKYGWDSMPNDLVPRLKGLHLKENSKFIYTLSKCLDYFKQLNKDHIDYAILNEGALKLLWLGDACQNISQLDIIVSDKDFDCCSNLALKQGFILKKSTVKNLHCVRYKYGDNCALNIHRCIYRNNLHKKEDFKLQMYGTGVVEKGNANLLVSGVESVYLQLMINGLDKLVSDTRPNYNLFFIIDLIDLKNHYQIDEDILAKLIKGSNLINKYSIAVKFLDCVMPGFFSFETALANQLGFRENVWNNWKHQIENIIQYKDKEQTQSIFRKIFQCFYYYAIVDELYLLDNNGPGKLYYFLIILFQRYKSKKS